MMIMQNCPVVSREEIAPGIYDYQLSSPELCGAAREGQFAMLAVPGFPLRRPVSICETDPEKGTVRFVFEVRGSGTEELSRRQAGDSIDLIAPLGNGFPLADPSQKVALIGGGIGVPPLLALAKRYGANCNAVLGFRTADKVILDTDFASYCDTVVCTDDGSWGVEGSVLPAVEALLMGCRPDILYCCGPGKMLQAVAELAELYGACCQVSLEERMACGVGACLGCPVKIRDGENSETYLRVCRDGPVFDARTVVWEG